MMIQIVDITKGITCNCVSNAADLYLFCYLRDAILSKK